MKLRSLFRRLFIFLLLPYLAYLAITECPYTESPLATSVCYPYNEVFVPLWNSVSDILSTADNHLLLTHRVSAVMGPAVVPLARSASENWAFLDAKYLLSYRARTTRAILNHWKSVAKQNVESHVMPSIYWTWARFRSWYTGSMGPIVEYYCSQYAASLERVVDTSARLVRLKSYLLWSWAKALGVRSYRLHVAPVLNTVASFVWHHTGGRLANVPCVQAAISFWKRFQESSSSVSNALQEKTDFLLSEIAQLVKLNKSSGLAVSEQRSRLSQVQDILDHVNESDCLNILGCHKNGEFIGSQKIEDSMGSQKIEDSMGSQKIEDSMSSQKNEDSIGSQKIEDSMSSQKNEDSIGSQKNEDSMSSQKIEDSMGSHKNEDSSDFLNEDFQDSHEILDISENSDTPDFQHDPETFTLTSTLTRTVTKALPKINTSVSKNQSLDTLSDILLQANDSVATVKSIDSQLQEELTYWKIRVSKFLNLTTASLQDEFSPYLEQKVAQLTESISPNFTALQQSNYLHYKAMNKMISSIDKDSENIRTSGKSISSPEVNRQMMRDSIEQCYNETETQMGFVESHLNAGHAEVMTKYFEVAQSTMDVLESFADTVISDFSNRLSGLLQVLQTQTGFDDKSSWSAWKEFHAVKESIFKVRDQIFSEAEAYRLNPRAAVPQGLSKWAEFIQKMNFHVIYLLKDNDEYMKLMRAKANVAYQQREILTREVMEREEREREERKIREQKEREERERREQEEREERERREREEREERERRERREREERERREREERERREREERERREREEREERERREKEYRERREQEERERIERREREERERHEIEEREREEKRREDKREEIEKEDIREEMNKDIREEMKKDIREEMNKDIREEMNKDIREEMEREDKREEMKKDVREEMKITELQQSKELDNSEKLQDSENFKMAELSIQSNWKAPLDSEIKDLESGETNESGEMQEADESLEFVAEP